jgi:hypothetical protein
MEDHKEFDKEFDKAVAEIKQACETRTERLERVLRQDDRLPQDSKVNTKVLKDLDDEFIDRFVHNINGTVSFPDIEDQARVMLITAKVYFTRRTEIHSKTDDKDKTIQAFQAQIAGLLNDKEGLFDAKCNVETELSLIINQLREDLQAAKDHVDVDHLLNKLGPEGLYKLSDKLIEAANKDVQDALSGS